MLLLIVSWVLLLPSDSAANNVVAPNFNGESGVAGREGNGGRSLCIARVGTNRKVETSLGRALRE